MGRGILAALPALVAAGCVGATQAEPERARGVSPEQVQVAAVRLEQTDDVAVAAGTVRALRSAQLASKIVGRIRSMLVKAGDPVHEGQVLALIEDAEPRARRWQYRAGLAQAHSSLEQARSELAAAEARAAVAATDYRRYERLLAAGAVPRQQFENAQAGYRQAVAARAAAEAARAGAAAQIAQARGALAGSSAQLQETRISAPFAGWVVQRHADPGDLAAPGVPLLVVEQRAPLRVEVALDEALLAEVQLGTRVEVSLGAGGAVVPGVIAELVPAVATPSRTFVAKIDLAADASPAHLRSGMFARVRVPVGTARRLTIPARAVAWHGQLARAFVVENGRAILRLLTVGAKRGSRTEVLSGLHEGEKVIVAPAQRLRDGAAVRVRAEDGR